MKKKQVRPYRLSWIPPSVGASIVVPEFNVAATARIMIGLIAAGVSHSEQSAGLASSGVLVHHPGKAVQRVLSSGEQGSQEIPQPQRDWFFANKAAIVAAHGGLYVAVSHKSVVLTNANLSRLVKEFYAQRGEADVYFGYAGEQEPAVGTPAYFGRR